MALGLFAQIGLLGHLFSLLVLALRATVAGLAAGAATAAAIVGRSLSGWLMPAGTDRRLVACASYLVRISGSLTLLLAGGDGVGLLMLGIVLFGAAIGNATSLPPLIQQIGFVSADVPRIVPLIVAICQAAHAFAPAVFGLIRAWTPIKGAAGAAPWVFATAAIIQALAIVALLTGRRSGWLRSER
jgi:hypothetical protein